jgi:hypothetical protein
MSTSIPASSPRAPVMEVFASIQGEGAYVGEPQVFLRLRGCPLRCRWCDTPGSWTLGASEQARIDARAACGARRPGSRPSRRLLDSGGRARRARTVIGHRRRAARLAEFVLALKAMLGPRRLHLETAGAHPRALARVVLACDHVSLDLKCPPTSTSPSSSPCSPRRPSGRRARPRNGVPRAPSACAWSVDATLAASWSCRASARARTSPSCSTTSSAWRPGCS